MTLDITQFYQTFFDEADELLAEMEHHLLALDLAAPDAEQLNAIFRAAHSIKGGAATFGFAALTETTHILESLLDRARIGEMALRADMVDLFLRSKDVLQELLATHRAGTVPDTAQVAAICAELAQIRDADIGAVPAQGGSVASQANTQHAMEADAAQASHAESEAGQASQASQASDALGQDAADALAGAGAADAAPAGGVPSHVVGALRDLNATAEGGAAHGVLKVVLTGVSEKDQALLSEELANLGELVGREQQDERLVLWVETDCSPDDIVAVCCFVIDTDQIEISRGALPAAAEAASVAAAAEAPAAPAPASVVIKDAALAPAPAATKDTSPVPATAATKDMSPAPATAATKDVAPAVAAKDGRAQPAARAAGAPALAESSIRVGVEKVDQLINLVGELVITQAMLAQTASNLDPVLNARLLSGLGQFERNARDLQEAVMSIRMMPMDYVFSRFPRLVRDLAAKLGKEVELVTFGQATELDKSLIERIVDPLTHLVRNSLDHGIETPAVRVAAGKPALGQLVLSAEHRGGNIVIEVSDNGAGLRRDKILAKALKQGMAVSESMSDEDVWNLIFMPGFSTAEQVTDVSGRGVGMDVVKRNIQGMGGHVDVRSVAGAGTTIRIVLPLTLAILDGMSVRVGNEIFILPLNFVMESLQPAAGDVYSVAGDERVIRVRGEYLPLIELHTVFDVSGARHDPTQGIVTIMQADGRRFALLVDDLVSQHQVVVKNLETNYRRVHGISAATILGDGSVALIVDVSSLSRGMSREQSVAVRGTSTIH